MATSLRATVIHSLATSIVVRATNVGTGILLARALGPDGKGIVAAVLLWPSLVAWIGGLTFNDSITHYVAKRPGYERQICATGLNFALIQSVTLMVAGYFLLPMLLGKYNSASVQISRLFLAWIPLSLSAEYMMSIIHGKQRFWEFNALRLLQATAMIGGLSVLYAMHSLSPISVVSTYLAVIALIVVASVVLVIRNSWMGLRPRLALLKPMVAYALKLHGGTLFYIANERSDSAMVAVFLVSADLGMYSIAVSFGAALDFIGLSLAFVAFPSLTACPDRATVQRSIAAFVQAALATSTLGVVLLLLLTPYLIKTFYGPAFGPAIPSASVLLIASLFLNLNSVLTAALKALNYPLTTGIAQSVAAPVMLTTLFFLLPRLGILAGAVASLIAYSASSGYMLYFLIRRLHFDLGTLLVPRSSDVMWAIRTVRASVLGLGSAGQRGPI